MRVNIAVALLLTTPRLAQQAPAPPPFRVEETSIARIHDAMKAGRLTCRGLVDAYLRALPVGVTFFGRAWSDAALIRFAFAYEQATRHRHPPASVPPLR